MYYLLLICVNNFVPSCVEGKIFPIEQLLNRTIADPSTFLCNTDLKPIARCCSCKNDCMVYHICCIDKLWNRQQSINLQTYIKSFIKTSSQYRDLECEEAFPFAVSHGHKSSSYFMVTTCGSGADEHDKNYCLTGNILSFQSSLPVIGNDNYLYKNMYCAQCNFVREFQTVDVKVECGFSNINKYQNITKQIIKIRCVQ